MNRGKVDCHLTAVAQVSRVFSHLRLIPVAMEMDIVLSCGCHMDWILLIAFMVSFIVVCLSAKGFTLSLFHPHSTKVLALRVSANILADLSGPLKQSIALQNPTVHLAELLLKPCTRDGHVD